MVAFHVAFSKDNLVLAPGLFFYLVRDATMQLDQLTPLLAVLPPEKIVVSNLRGGEAFDSTRWPVAYNAEFASLAARCLDEPALLQALHTIEQARRDRSTLRALARASTAQALASGGGTADLFLTLWSDATPEDLALFSAPPIPLETADMVQSLYHAHYQAADGLYAYHVSRGYPGPSAEAAARIVKRAIELDKLHRDELVTLAIAMVRKANPSPR